MIFPDAILWLLDGVCLLFGHVAARATCTASSSAVSAVSYTHLTLPTT